MRYRRMPIEIEGPEQLGYDSIRYNLSESSVTDIAFRDLNIDLNQVVLAYDDHLGRPKLRELIAADAPNLHPDQVMTTVGAAAALFIVATTLLEKDDHMVVVFPNYATNLETPRQIGANVEQVVLRFEEGWRLDVDDLAARIRPETKYVSITVPHNPTGGMVTEDDLRRLVGIVEEKGCRLLVDETYREMGYEAVLPVAASLSPRVISVASLSKTYGLPGIRTGWLICQDAALMETFLAAKEQIFITNPVLDEEIAAQFLAGKAAFLKQKRAEIQARLDIVREWVAEEPGISWVEPRGGVVSFPRIEADVDVDRFYDILLKRYQTYVGPGHWFDCDRRHFRLGFGWSSMDELRAGLTNISQALRDAT